VFTRSRRVWKVEWTSQSQSEGDDEVQDEQQYVSEPDVTAYDDDGHVVADATAEMTQWIDRMQEDNRRAVAQLKPHELARFETWLRTRTRDAPPVRPPSRPANGHAPREARNDRHRGSRRGERAKSSSSDDPEPEPPAARPCACGCGHPRQQGDNYYDPVECKRRHARERKQKQRARDRDEPNRIVERRLPGLTLADLPTKCRPGCGGEAVYEDPEGAIVCVACGRPKTRGRLRVNSYDAHLAEVRGGREEGRRDV
jgi:hypothetical protein